MKLNFTNNFFNSPFRGQGGGSVSVHSPATVANMVCGFDVLGFAVNDPYDEMHNRAVVWVPARRVRRVRLWRRTVY